MKVADPTSVPRIVAGGSLMLAPIAFLASAISSPALKANQSAQLNEVTRHPDRWYLFALFSIVGSMLLVPAVIALMSLIRRDAAWLAYLGCGLAGLGALVGLCDSANQLVVWQMAAPNADHTQMTALANRLDQATGAAIIFMIGGIALIVGFTLLAIGIQRTRAARTSIAAGIPLSVIANIAGFAADNTPLLIASCIIMLATLGSIGRAVLAEASTPEPHSTEMRTRTHLTA